MFANLISVISPKLTAQQSELYLLRKIIFILLNIVLVWDINDFLWENDQYFLIDSYTTTIIRRVNAFISIVFDCLTLYLVYRLHSKGLTWVAWTGMIRICVQSILIGLGIVAHHFFQERYLISQTLNFIVTITVIVFQVFDGFLIWLIFILIEFIRRPARLGIQYI